MLPGALGDAAVRVLLALILVCLVVGVGVGGVLAWWLL